MQEQLKRDEFNERRVFSAEAIFHTNSKVNRNNVCIWGEENTEATIEHEKDSPKINMFCAIFKNHVMVGFLLFGKL